MKLVSKLLISGIITASATAAVATPATSEKHANKSVEWRQAMFQLIASNMGPLGAMARGKMPLDAALVEKNATRINQLSYMIEDYMAVDTTKFSVKTEALDKVWQQPEEFKAKVNALIEASANLASAAKSGDEGAIKGAIGGVGKSCKGCHDQFKMD